jgi:hypothetical protein
LWAKAEAELHLKPLAKTALQIKANSKTGGKNSGEVRRKIAEEGWKKIAKKLAFVIRTRQPSLSQDRLVKAIDGAWENNRPIAPQFPTLKKYVSYLEKNEGLPVRLRKVSDSLAPSAAE